MFFFLCGLYTKVSSTEVIWYLYPKQTLENTERQAKMNNPKKLTIFDTKNTVQYKIRCYDITEILLNVALNTMTLLPCSTFSYYVNFYIITLFALLYVQVGVLLTRGKQLHHFTKRGGYGNNPSWTPPPFFASFCDCDIWLWDCSQRMEFILLFSLFIF